MSNKFENKIVNLIKEAILNINDENKVQTRLEIQKLFSEFASNIFSYNFLFTYGTLRRGQDMYKKMKALFGPHGIEYISTNRCDYKKIVDLGPYPALLESRSPDYVIGDIIYLSDEAFAYVKDIMESQGFLEDSATIWVPNGAVDSRSVKILAIPMFMAGDKLTKQIEDNKIKYPKIEICDWVRYQKQTSPYLTEAEKNLQMQMWDSYGYYGD